MDRSRTTGGAGYDVIDTKGGFVGIRHRLEDEELRKMWVISVDEIDTLMTDLVELATALEYRY